MSENLNKKIIELESKFSILVKKYNELKSINNKLNEELTENVTPIGRYTHNSGYGAKCKVEIISRSDYLRATGYKTEDS